MVTCEVCGSEDFEKHEGFLYCAVCQTQSQDYHEEEYEYRDHEFSTIRRRKLQEFPGAKTKQQKVYDDGMWTTWEAFNYILFGMMEEIKRCGVRDEFEKMVFKLWAAYLRECQAAFTSKSQEKIPKLNYSFKQRDARILYNAELPSSDFKEKRKGRSQSSSSRTTHISNSSTSSQSKRLTAIQRNKVISADYEEVLSLSMQSRNTLADETLESLGKSSDAMDTSESADESDGFFKGFKKMLRKDDYQRFKNSYKSKRLRKTAKEKWKKDVRFPGKNKLLSIIHLALLMTESEIQLSDLFRFIREGHLSFAKVTHFFPRNMKLPKNDFTYIEITSDSLMPTHLHQRKIAGQMGYLLKIGKIPTTNLNLLADRYCKELNLPKQVAELSKKVLVDHVPPGIIPRVKSALACFEAWVMASIIFILKLLFGLNDRTEIFLSQLAHEVNSLQNNEPLLFEFEDWQKYIECRKTVLSVFHYPTQEQLNRSPLQSSKKFLHILGKESKDEYRNERFIPYSKYYIDEKLLDEVKQVLNALSKPQHSNALDFQPSLTPQISHLETIMRHLDSGKENSKFPHDVLRKSFEECSIEFAFNPKTYTDSLKKEGLALSEKFYFDHDIPPNESFSNKVPNENILTKCSSNYWIMKYPNASSAQLGNFGEVFEKTPNNFQWLMTECARMLEMNVRDVYDQLLHLEGMLSP